MNIWEQVARPPKEALKQITGGRLSGMTDVKPQWRYKIMTEVFGPCGAGWKYEIVRFWSHEAGAEVMAFCEVNLYYRDENKEWSEPIPGIGGSMLTAIERKGPYNSDEAYKMALTDALSVAMKALGVAADIYMGMWDGSKYHDVKEEQSKPVVKQHVNEPVDLPGATKEQRNELRQLAKDFGDGTPEAKKLLAYADNPQLTVQKATEVIHSASAVLDGRRS